MGSMLIKFIGVLTIVVIVIYAMFHAYNDIYKEKNGGEFMKFQIEDKVDENIYYSNSSLLAGQNGYVDESCACGHIANMAPVCGTDGCLKTLTGPVTLKTSSMMGNVRDIATKTKGWMRPQHIDTIKHLTQMQWSYGIYGSVGEIGVYYGKLASVLATFTATEYGERFFVCDIFKNPKHYMKVKTAIGRKDEFEKTMKSVGFSIYTNNEPKRIRVWDDSSIYLSKLLYKTMNLPSFRMYSIDGNHFEPFVLNDLKHVSCVLREGGIIAVDDYDTQSTPGIKSALRYFMKMFGSNVVVPLAIVRPKIYLCTASWHERYMTYIEKNGIDKAMRWCKRTKAVLDIKSTLYQNC